MADLRHLPERTCVGCFKKKAQADLVAVTRLKNGEIIVRGLNLDPKTAGRSVYLCSDMMCFKKAKNRKGKNGLEYGLKVKIQPEVWQELEQRVGVFVSTPSDSGRPFGLTDCPQSH